MKDTFYATLESVVDHCPRQDTLFVLGDLNASTGTEREVVRHVMVPMGLEMRTRTALSCLTLQEVMDLGCLVHGFNAERLITGFGIPTLVNEPIMRLRIHHS